MLVIYARNLFWEYSAETIAILSVEIVVAVLTLRRIHTLVEALVLSLYPFSLMLVALLSSVIDKRSNISPLSGTALP
jgi:hypothetical protein